jgi:hypothetical protein
MLFSGRAEATETLLLARLEPRCSSGQKYEMRVAHILDILRVPVVLHPALLDLIDNPPPTVADTL